MFAGWEVDTMTQLDGFIPFDFSEGVPYVSVTNNGITFNKSSVTSILYFLVATVL